MTRVENSIALACPSARMVIVKVIAEVVGMKYTGKTFSFFEPVVAIRSSLDDEGFVRDEVLVWDFEDGLVPLSSRIGENSIQDLAVCHWPPGEDKDRLASLVSDLERILKEKIGEARKEGK